MGEDHGRNIRNPVPGTFQFLNGRRTKPLFDSTSQQGDCVRREAVSQTVPSSRHRRLHHRGDPLLAEIILCLDIGTAHFIDRYFSGKTPFLQDDLRRDGVVLMAVDNRDVDLISVNGCGDIEVGHTTQRGGSLAAW